MAWQLQEAKQRFSEVVRLAEAEGPQIVTRHGAEVAVVVSIEEWRAVGRTKPDLRDFLLAPGPPYLDGLDLTRHDLPRPIPDFSE
ncbi:MAG TPA: type II toxin-antitoxin system Phd/YefM family antitoxin [Sporichthyaceae bacterium]|jgi:prevent-host-death family protein|nr:type II toxin-antitoxin system Phd/YefM family antitoxin [Sporichthyaceae bacterium]